MSRIPDLKAALYTAAGGLYAPQRDVLVCYGHPGAHQPDDIVAIGPGASSETSTGPMAARHPRDESADIVVTVSCWRGGTDQQTVTERAYALLGLLETYVQTTSPSLGLAGVRMGALVSHDLAETEEGEDLDVGRIAEIRAVFRFQCRI